MTAKEALNHKWLTSLTSEAAPAVGKVCRATPSTSLSHTLTLVLSLLLIAAQGWFRVEENVESAPRRIASDETRRCHSARRLITVVY